MKPKKYTPGPGWTNIRIASSDEPGPCWKHSTGITIHPGGRMIKFGPGRPIDYSGWTVGTELRRHILIAGGNIKRGLMTFALQTAQSAEAPLNPEHSEK